MRKNVSGGVNDFSDDVGFAQVHSFMRRAGDSTGHAHLAGTVVGEKPGTQYAFTAAYDRIRAGVTADQRAAQAAPAADAQQRQQLDRHADKRIGLFPHKNIPVFPVAQSGTE